MCQNSWIAFSACIPSKLLVATISPVDCQWGRTYNQGPKRELNFCSMYKLLLSSIHPTAAMLTLPGGHLLGNLSSLVWNKAISVTFIPISDSMPRSQLNTRPQGLPYNPIQPWLILKIFSRSLGGKNLHFLHYSFRSEIFSSHWTWARKF